MLTAKEAHEMAVTHNKYTAKRVEKRIQQIIKNRAAQGYFWYAWDYDCDEEITTKERQNIMQSFKDAEYDVTENKLVKVITIRW